MIPEDKCDTCIVGCAAGVGRGQFCPWIPKTLSPGDILYRIGQSANYVYFVKAGEVGLARGSALDEVVPANQFIGTEALTGETYECTALAVTNVELCEATKEGIARWLACLPRASRSILDQLAPE